MLVCTRPLIVDYYGEEVRLIPGVDRVAPDHPIVRAHRSYFKAAPGGPTRARDVVYASDGGGIVRLATEATAHRHQPVPAAGRGRLAAATVELPSEPHDLEPWRILGDGIRSRPGSFALRLTNEVQAAIESEVLVVDPGLETGGLIYGSRGAEPLEAVTACGAGPLAVRGPDRFRFHLDWCSQRDAEMAAEGLERVGEWHSHTDVGEEEATAPSAADVTPGGGALAGSHISA